MLTTRSEDGSTVVESVFAILFLVTLLLGTVQVVFTLYSRNVVRSAAQEGARSAIERGATGADATDAARSTVARAASGLVRDLHVATSRTPSDDGDLITVRVQGHLRPLGPLPFSSAVTAQASALAPSDPR